MYVIRVYRLAKGLWRSNGTNGSMKRDITIHPAAHGGVQGEIEIFDEHFIVLEVGFCGAGFFDSLELLGWDDFAFRARGQDDSLVC